MFRRITRPATETMDARDVSIYQTNGTEYVSLRLTDETAPRRERVNLHLEPDDAIELAASLLLGALNVQVGLHGNSGKQYDVHDGNEAETHELAQDTLSDWIGRRARERRLAEIREGRAEEVAS